MTDIGLPLPSTPARARPARGRAAVLVPALVVWGVVLVNAVVVVWLWWHGGNVNGVHTTGDQLTSVGRITGLLCAYLSLVQVLLLARLPWIERWTGFDRLTVWHRRNGKIVLYLLLAHVIFTTWGYMLVDNVDLGEEIRRLLTQYPGMITATIGTVLMILVVVTSLVVVRRAMNYESWHAVHLLAYAGIALGWFHQVPTGNEFTASTAAADYWLSLYLVTLALLLVFRVGAPIWQAYRYGMRVVSVTPEAPGVVSLRVSGRRMNRLRTQPGQFFLWRFLDRRRWWQAHPFSLSEAPTDDELRITVRASGDFTADLAAIAPGTRVVTEGPFGIFTGTFRRKDRVLLVAGGIGITPLRAMLEELDCDTVLLYRVVQESDLVFADELEALAAARRVELHFVVGDHRAPGGGDLLAPARLRELVPDVAEREVWLCGPPSMMRAASRSLREAGVPKKLIHSERFAL